tara:strand:- start:11924 stop:12337 length:414 start_codon:yes stop_codon:yes gene_type:complete
MAKKRGRGGYRKPTPTRKNAVSGPGALSQRTDGAQPVMRLPDAKYGESKAFEEQQQGAPLGDSGGANAPLPLQGQQMSPNVFAPTEIPGQPITEGVPIGEGAGPAYDVENNVDILLSAMYSVNPHPLIAQLINGRSE